MKNVKFVELRLKNNFSQERLASVLYVPTTTIRKWEQMKAIPSIDEMKEMAKLFSVEEEEIFLLFRPEKTKTERQQEIEEEMYDVFQDLFWGVCSGEQFIKFSYLAKLVNQTGIITYKDYIFPFTKIYVNKDSCGVAFSDDHFNMIVLTELNMIDVVAESVNYEVYTISVTLECPMFPPNNEYDSNNFQQIVKVSFFNR